MPIMDDVSAKLMEAMKSKDADRTSALRMIRAALLEAAKSGKGPLNDTMAVETIQRVRKQRAEAADEYVKAGRPDLATKERAEMVVAEEFLPKTADEQQTLTWVREAIAATSAVSKKEIGKVMGALMKAHKGEMDAGLARRLAESELTD